MPPSASSEEKEEEKNSVLTEFRISAVRPNVSLATASSRYAESNMRTSEPYGKTGFAGHVLSKYAVISKDSSIKALVLGH